MPPKLRSKIILESYGSGYNVAEIAYEELVLAMVEQFEENAASFLQEEHVSDNQTRQERTTNIGNVDVPIHFPNAIEEF